MTNQQKIEKAHKLILLAAEGPSLAILHGKASRAWLGDSLEKMSKATRLINEVLGVEG